MEKEKYKEINPSQSQGQGNALSLCGWGQKGQHSRSAVDVQLSA